MHPDLQEDSWAEFTHTTSVSPISAHELLEQYRLFKQALAKLSRKDLIERHWLTGEDDFSRLSEIFFDLPLARQPTLFRKAANADDILLSIWQSRARAEAEWIAVHQSVSNFTKLTKGDLRVIAKKSVEPMIVRSLPGILAKLGVIVVYIRSLPGMKADGALFRLSTGNPVVAMSLRFPRLDYFWFTLLHELAHLVLHVEQLEEPVFFDVEAEEENKVEVAANRLAKDSLVERGSWRNCKPKYDPSENAVKGYAAEQGVHPSIVAGLLARETGNYARHSRIINEYDVRKIIFRS